MGFNSVSATTERFSQIHPVDCAEELTHLGEVNLQLTVDAQRLVGWPDATVFLYGLGIHGGHPSTT